MRRLCGPIQFLVGKSELIPSRSPVRGCALAATMVLLALTQVRTATAQMGGYSYPPYAQNDSSMTMEEMPVSIAVLNNDYGMSAPLNPASIHIVSAPSHGVAAVEASTGHVWYFPNTEFCGMDSFTYTVSNMSGQTSNAATVMIGVMADSTPPVINTVTESRGPASTWRISGTVTDDDPAHVIVHFGGLLAGEYATVNADGTFSLDVYLSPGEFGGYSAQAVNAELVSSAIVFGDIDNP